MQLLIRSPRTYCPGVHADDVTISAMKFLGQLDESRLVEVFKKEGVAVEDRVDASLEVTVFIRYQVDVISFSRWVKLLL